jgi:hypothetical protein
MREEKRIVRAAAFGKCENHRSVLECEGDRLAPRADMRREGARSYGLRSELM